MNQGGALWPDQQTRPDERIYTAPTVANDLTHKCSRSVATSGTALPCSMTQCSAARLRPTRPHATQQDYSSRISGEAIVRTHGWRSPGSGTAQYARSRLFGSRLPVRFDFATSARGDHAQRCLAVIAKPHFVVEPTRARVVAHDVKKGRFAALHFAADQF